MGQLAKMSWVLTIVTIIPASWARADDAADQKALKDLVDKAIKAQGGAEKLKKFKATTFKMKGKFYGMGDGIEYTGEVAGMYPDKSKSVINVDVGQKFTVTQVLNGDKLWVSANGMVTEGDKDALAEAKEVMYAQYVKSLFVLKDKKYKLEPLGESKVNDIEVIGIRVSSKDHRDVNLYINKKNSLLVKSETQVKDQMAGGKEVNQETFYEDYKDVDGMPAPHKILIHHDGKIYVDAVISEIKSTESLDDSLFGKP
jgi:hypothetical protein